MLQTGIELIGSDTVAAVAEVLRVALDALEAAGVRNVSVDLTLPNLVEALAAGPMPLAAEKVPELQACLDGKDAAGRTPLGADAYQPLIAAAGPVDQALQRLRTLNPAHGTAARLDAVSLLPDGLRNRAAVTTEP